MSKAGRLEKGAPTDWPSLALLEFTVALARAMKTNDMKQADLAKALGVSRAYISSVMAGNENLTVEQMSRLAEAAGGALHLTVAEEGRLVRWVEDALEDAGQLVRPPFEARVSGEGHDEDDPQSTDSFASPTRRAVG